nr:hypothetical protein [Tanacetum cinerariifolium]
MDLDFASGNQLLSLFFGMSYGTVCGRQLQIRVHNFTGCNWESHLLKVQEYGAHIDYLATSFSGLHGFYAPLLPHLDAKLLHLLVYISPAYGLRERFKADNVLP